jgi:hypothetical protein
MKTKIFTTMAFVSLLAAATFCACSKDENGDDGGNSNPIWGKTGTVAITVENGASYNNLIDEVELMYGDGVVLSRASYDDGSFTIELPASVDSKYLDELEEEFSATFKVSNPSVKMATAWLIVRTSSSRWIGDFYHGTEEWEGKELLYVTGDVSMTGTAPDGIFNVHLKKGWNLVYEYERKGADEVTTTAPAGAKWYFDYDE